MAESLNCQYLEKGKQIFEVAPDSNDIAACVNRGENGFVRQRLKCIIKAGNEFFSILDATASENGFIVDKTVITRHVADGRAELYSILNTGEKVLIGRSSSPDLDRSVSRNHIVIGKNHEGVIGFGDVGSSNGTEVFTSKIDYKENDSNDINPIIKNINFWSIKSSSLKEELFY